MQCPFKLCESEVMSFADGNKRTQYYYQECAMTACVMWSDRLNDCRLALSGMVAVEQQEHIYKEHSPKKVEGTNDV